MRKLPFQLNLSSKTFQRGFFLNPWRFAIVGGGAGVGVLWNPSDKAANITLTNSNKSASDPASTQASVRGVIGHTSGKWYFEIATSSAFTSGSTTGCYFGVADASVSLTAQPIFGSPGGHYCAWRGNGQVGNETGSSGTPIGAISSNGVNVVGVAVDIDAKTVSFYLNNTLAATSTFGTPTGAIYPFGSLSVAGFSLDLFTTAATFTYTPPSGYSAWGDAAVGVPPSSIANLQLWIDGTNAATLYKDSSGTVVSADGDAVEVARDASGTFARGFRNTTTARPIYKTGMVNGKSVIRFTRGSSQYLQAITTTAAGNGIPSGNFLTAGSVYGASAKTAILAVRLRDGNPGQGNVYSNDAVFDDAFAEFGLHIASVNNTVNYYGYNWDGNSDSVSLSGIFGSWAIVTLRHDGVNLRMRINGGGWVSVASGATQDLTHTLQLGLGSGSTYCSMDLAHAAWWNAVVSDADVASVEYWMADQLGLFAAEEVLLLHNDGSNGVTAFVDSSVYSNPVTAAGNAQISTAQSKFGGASGYFDGNGDYLTIPSAPHFDFGSKDWCIDCWIRYTSTGTNQVIFTKATGNGYYAVQIHIDSTGHLVARGYDNGGTPTQVFTNTSAGTITTGQWTHIAVTRESGNVKLWINGTLDTTGVLSPNGFSTVLRYNTSEPVVIAALSDGVAPFSGYIDELRVVVGSPVYTGNFTPATSAFADPFLNATFGYYDKGATSIAFSNNNRTVTVLVDFDTTIAHAARTLPKYSGKWYYEMHYDIKNGTSTNMRTGILSTNAFPSEVGDNGSGIAVSYGSDGGLYRGSFTSSWGPTFGQGDTVMVAVDVDAKKVWFGKNGTWLNSGNPATGANPAYTFSSLGDGMRAAATDHAGGLNSAWTINSTSSDVTYTPPTGFAPWNSTRS